MYFTIKNHGIKYKKSLIYEEIKPFEKKGLYSQIDDLHK